MDNFETEFEKFILWFSDQEDVPAESRVNLLDHLLAVGDIDEKSEKFIVDTLTHLAAVSQAKADELKQHLDGLKAAIAGQEDPKFSLVEHILADAEEKIQAQAGGFKMEFAEFQKEKSDTEEGIEKSDEASELKTIKSQL